MAKIIIPDNLKGKDLFKFLVENKSGLVAQKKAFIKHADVVAADPYYVTREGKLASTKAADGVAPTLPEDTGSVKVKMVCNACNWCDSQMDVLLDNSSKKTIQQRQGLIPHLADHTHKLAAQIGDVEAVYLQDVSLRELGVNKAGSTQCIIMESVVQKSYDPKVYDLYRKGKVNQHSIGLQYVQLELAINDSDYEKEQDFWNKYYDKVINKDVVDEMGFFWVVAEIKLLENSGVLFGSNELTPTLETGKSHSPTPAGPASSEEPAKDAFSMDVAILTTKFNF